jgi:hypothetical protein
VISVQTIVLSLESLQIRRNHNWLKSLSFFFSPALIGGATEGMRYALGHGFDPNRIASLTEMNAVGCEVRA